MSLLICVMLPSWRNGRSLVILSITEAHPFSEPTCYTFYHCFVSRAIVVDPLEQIRCFTVSALCCIYLCSTLVLKIGLRRVLGRWARSGLTVAGDERGQGGAWRLSTVAYNTMVRPKNTENERNDSEDVEMTARGQGAARH